MTSILNSHSSDVSNLLTGTIAAVKCALHIGDADDFGGFVGWIDEVLFNSLVTNEPSHPYHLDESIFLFRDIRSNFSFSFHFSMNFL